MKKSVIALVFDFDETLGFDSITYLLEKNNISYEDFWPRVYDMVKDSWDPPLAYMHVLLAYAQKGKIDLSQKALRDMGASLPLFAGIPQVFDELQQFVKEEEIFHTTNVTLEYYVISGGLEEMMLGSSIAEHMTGIFGSSFAYDGKMKKPLGIKTAISFTEKTRYLFGINKGLSVSELRTKPYRINDVVPDGQRRVPFSQMIYIGDGPSDIPTLSVIAQYGGTGIGVVSPHKTFKKGYELARGRRITVGPYTANYTAGSDMRKVLEATILKIGLEIAENKEKHVQ
jgi:hypothetical protein